MPRAARRAQLLRVADGLFTERGYEATSMDDVAAAAEISKPVLYDHFGSKEGLFAACVEQVGDELTDAHRSGRRRRRRARGHAPGHLRGPTSATHASRATCSPCCSTPGPRRPR